MCCVSAELGAAFPKEGGQYAFLRDSLGIPLLVLIFSVYYGLPVLGLNLDNFVAAVVALSLFKSAHVLEIVRGADALVMMTPWNEYRQLDIAALKRAMRGRLIVDPYRLLRGKARHDTLGLTKTIALAEPILLGLGFGPGRVATIETDDPDALVANGAASALGSDPYRTVTSPSPTPTGRGSASPPSTWPTATSTTTGRRWSAAACSATSSASCRSSTGSGRCRRTLPGGVRPARRR